MKHATVWLLAILATGARAAEPVQFARDVLPVLSANCYACHGPDEHNRKAKLRLDIEGEAKKPRDGGTPIAAGQPDESLIIERLTSDDPDIVMPPPKSHKTVKPEQIEAIRRWIAEGARWQRHWSFEPVVKPPGTLDDQVKASLGKKGLSLRGPAAPQESGPPALSGPDRIAADPRDRRCVRPGSVARGL